MIHYYSGIGSRQTPRPILLLMTRLAQRFQELGWVLRSGGAPGADQAFQMGAAPDADIYLPWPSFEKAFQDKYPVHFTLPRPSPAALQAARHYHPAWKKLTDASQLLHSRNLHQVLGQTLHNPSTLLACWTKDGAEKTQECGYETGGTGTAIRVACRYNIPIFNLAKEGSLERLGALVKSIEAKEKTNGTSYQVRE